MLVQRLAMSLVLGVLGVLGACRVPVTVPGLAAGAPGPFGSRSAAAAARESERTTASSAIGADRRLDRSGRDRAGGDVPVARPAAGDLDDPTPTRGAGRLSLYADPALAFAWQDETASDPPQEPKASKESRWSDFLPLGREAVLAAGYELPRAFGFDVAYTRLRRDIEVDEVRVGLDGAPPRTVDFLSVEADSVVDNVMGRLDAWVFPFWNVSLLGGWTWNQSDSRVTVNIPLPINPTDVTLDVPTRQEGPTWGFGTNLAAGYGDWFISGDGSWIHADMSDFAVIEAFLGSIRSGWNGKVDDVPVRLWGGATYWDTATTIEGSAPTSGGTLGSSSTRGPSPRTRCRSAARSRSTASTAWRSSTTC
jgi:hypothetical protein